MRSQIAFDEAIMRVLAQHRMEWTNHLAFGVMALGTTLPGLALCMSAAGMLVVHFRVWRGAAAALGSVLLAGCLAAELKHLFERARPPADLALVDVGGSSFPSTQATETAAMFVAVLVAVTWPSRKVRRIAATHAAFIVVVVGCCMVYLGAHWMTDVLAGWALGAFLGALTGWIARPRNLRGDRRSMVI